LAKTDLLAAETGEFQGGKRMSFGDGILAGRGLDVGSGLGGLLRLSLCRSRIGRI
jgi:hypothetical protein